MGLQTEQGTEHQVEIPMPVQLPIAEPEKVPVGR